MSSLLNIGARDVLLKHSLSVEEGSVDGNTVAPDLCQKFAVLEEQRQDAVFQFVVK